MLNIFKVNNKDTRTTSMASLSCFYCQLWTYFTPCVFLLLTLNMKLPTGNIVLSFILICLSSGLKFLCRMLPKNWMQCSYLVANLCCRSSLCNILMLITLHKKWGFPLKISSVNVTKSAGRLRICSHLLKKSLMENLILMLISGIDDFDIDRHHGMILCNIMFP